MVDCSEESDAAALRAALSAMDDWDCDLSSLLGFDSDRSSSSDVSRPKKPKKRGAVAPYKQRKQEIAALRVEVEELQSVLALEKALTINVPGVKSNIIEDAALELEWERLATSQKHERFAAQLANAKLRKLLQSQTKNAEKILKLTKRVKVLEDALPVPPAATFDSASYRLPYLDPQAQLQRLVSGVARANEIFTSGAFAAEAMQCFRALQFLDTKPAVEGVDFVVDTAWVLPFEVARVADALWSQTTRPTFTQKSAAFMDIHEDASSLVSQFIATKAPGENWGASQGQMAVRRFPPDPSDGSVLIGVTSRVRVYSGWQWKTTVVLDGWLQVKRVISKDVNSTQPLTQIKWHRRVLVEPPDSAILTDSQRCQWANSVVSGSSRSRFEKELDWSLQAIENLLLTPERDR